MTEEIYHKLNFARNLGQHPIRKSKTNRYPEKDTKNIEYEHTGIYFFETYNDIVYAFSSKCKVFFQKKMLILKDPETVNC
jgi:hypothetical protein